MSMCVPSRWPEVKIAFKIELCEDLTSFLQGWPTMGEFSNEGIFERFGELHQILGQFESRLAMVKSGRD